MNNGYLNEWINKLLTAEAPAERAVAVRTLGIIGSRLATAHLIAALFDRSPEVCRAAAEALARIGDPAVAAAPLQAILAAESDQLTATGDEPSASRNETLIAGDLPAESVAVSSLIDQQPPIRESNDEGEERFLEELDTLSHALQNLQNQLLKTEAAHSQVREEVLLAAAKEARCAGQAAALSREEQEFRTLAEGAGKRRSELEASLKIARKVLQETEQRAANLGAKKKRLRAESDRLGSAAAKVELETVKAKAKRRKVAVASTHAAAERARREAEELQQAQLERLRREEEEHRRATAELASQQLEVEAARRAVIAQTLLLAEQQAQISVEGEAQRLENERVHHAARERCRQEQEELRQQEETLRCELEAVARHRAEVEAARRAADLETRKLKKLLQAADADRQAIATERRRLETEARQRAETEQRLLEEFRQRVQEEQVRLDEVAGRAVEEEQRLAEIPTNGHAQVTSGVEVWLSGQARALPTAAVSNVSIGSGQGLIPINCNSAKIAAATAQALDSLDPQVRAKALSELGHSGATEAFSLIVKFFDDLSPDVRNAAARALYDLEPHRRVESFSRAIEESAPARCRNIGRALVASGLAKKAIDNLNGDDREETYNALCLLFVMAKTGEVQPLVRAVEKHSNVDVRRAAIKLLTLNGHSEIAAAAVKHRLMMQT